MYKRFKIAAVLAAGLLVAVMVLTGCGASKPTAEDAQAYVQATLDMICTGDYDHSVNLVDVEEGKESEFRDEMIRDVVSGIASEYNLSDDASEVISDFMLNAFGKAKFTVGEATPTDDGGFDVQVTVEPLVISQDALDEFEDQIPDVLGYSIDELAAMSENELNNVIMLSMFKFLNGKLDSPSYGSPQEVSVYYGLIDEENNIYGCTSEEGEKVGSLLFSMDGIE